MGGRHDHAGEHHLHVPGDTVVHRLPAAVKLLGLLVFTTAVALTPRRAVGAFVVDAGVLIAVISVARLRAGLVLRRLVIIVPFLVVAALLPFIGEGGDTVQVGGRSLSVEGCWAAWNIAAKATLGATASIVLSATTPIPDLLAGLGRLRVPPTLVAIMAFMVRYLDLVVDQLRRMRRAMVARGHDPRWLWQSGPIGASAGALFVRTYERGERVHQAMSARGFTGSMPTLTGQAATRRQRFVAAGPGAVAIAALAIAVVTP